MNLRINNTIRELVAGRGGSSKASWEGDTVQRLYPGNCQRCQSFIASPAARLDLDLGDSGLSCFPTLEQLADMSQVATVTGAASAGAASALRLLSEVLVVASEVLVDHNSHELVCFKTSVRHLYPSLLNLPTLGHLDTTQKL